MHENEKNTTWQGTKRRTSVTISPELFNFARQSGIKLSVALSRGIRQMANTQPQSNSSEPGELKAKVEKLAQRLTEATVRIHDLERLIK